MIHYGKKKKGERILLRLSNETDAKTTWGSRKMGPQRIFNRPDSDCTTGAFWWIHQW